MLGVGQADPFNRATELGFEGVVAVWLTAFCDKGERMLAFESGSTHHVDQPELLKNSPSIRGEPMYVNEFLLRI